PIEPGIDDSGRAIEIFEAGIVIGRLDDDLVPVGGRVLVREHADRPWIAVAPDLRRRLVLVAGAEGADDLLVAAEGVRAEEALGREEHWRTGDRIPADHGARSSRRASARRWATPRSANADISSARPSAIVKEAKRSAAQPFVKTM